MGEKDESQLTMARRALYLHISQMTRVFSECAKFCGTVVEILVCSSPLTCHQQTHKPVCTRTEDNLIMSSNPNQPSRPEEKPRKFTHMAIQGCERQILKAPWDRAEMRIHMETAR